MPIPYFAYTFDAKFMNGYGNDTFKLVSMSLIADVSLSTDII